LAARRWVLWYRILWDRERRQ